MIAACSLALVKGVCKHTAIIYKEEGAFINDKRLRDIFYLEVEMVLEDDLK